MNSLTQGQRERTPRIEITSFHHNVEVSKAKGNRMIPI